MAEKLTEGISVRNTVVRWFERSGLGNALTMRTGGGLTLTGMLKTVNRHTNMRVQHGLGGRGLFGAALVLLLATWHTSQAGEPISFSGSKTVEKPVRPSTAQKEALQTIDKPSSPFELDEYKPSTRERRSYDRNRARRAKNARDERNNWMWVDSGSLQEREDRESAFGIRSYSIEAMDDRGESGDLTFSEQSTFRSTARDEDRQKREDRIPIHLRSPRERQILEARAASERNALGESEEASIEESRNQNKRNQETQGAHVSQELDLRTLLASPDTAGKGGGKSDLTLSDFLNSDAKAASRPADEDRSSALRQLLGLPQPEQFTAPNRLDAVNVRPDFRLNPPASLDVKAPPAEASRPPSGLPGAPLPWANPISATLPRPGVPDLATPARAPLPRDLGPSLGGPNSDKRGPAAGFDPPRRGGLLGR